MYGGDDRLRLLCGKSFPKRLDSERAAKEAQLEAIGARVAAAAARALHEYAEGVKNAYAFAVVELRERAAQLIALHRLTGSHEGGVCFDIPNFTGRREFAPIRIEESHISGARAVWANLMAAWRSNPFADCKRNLMSIWPRPRFCSSR